MNARIIVGMVATGILIAYDVANLAFAVLSNRRSIVSTIVTVSVHALLIIVFMLTARIYDWIEDAMWEE